MRCSEGTGGLLATTCGSGAAEDGFCCTRTTEQMNVSLASPCTESTVDVYMFVDPIDDECSTYDVWYDF